MNYKRMPIPYEKLRNKLADARDELQRVIEVANDLQGQIDEATSSANRFSKIVQYFSLQERKEELRSIIEKLSIQVEGARYDNEK